MPINQLQRTTKYKPSFARYEIRDTRYEQFLQNKPNFRKAGMNLSFYSTKDYVNLHLRTRFKNKAKLRKARMDASLAITMNNEQQTVNYCCSVNVREIPNFFIFR
jgi:hypothetical protein